MPQHHGRRSKLICRHQRRASSSRNPKTFPFCFGIGGIIGDNVHSGFVQVVEVVSLAASLASLADQSLEASQLVRQRQRMVTATALVNTLQGRSLGRSHRSRRLHRNHSPSQTLANVTYTHQSKSNCLLELLSVDSVAT